MRWSIIRSLPAAGFGITGGGILFMLVLSIVLTGLVLGAGRNSGGALLVHTDDAVS